MGPLELMVEEYRTLRQEVLLSNQERNRLLAFGSTVLALLFAGGFTILSKERKICDVISLWNISVNTQDFLITIIFTFSIPLLVFIVLFLLQTEAHRLARAGFYLAKLENKINSFMRQNYVALQMCQSADFPSELQFSIQELVYLLYWENWLKQKRYHFRYGALIIGFLFNSVALLSWLISFPYAQKLFCTSPQMVLSIEAIAFLISNGLLIALSLRVSRLMLPRLHTN